VSRKYFRNCAGDIHVVHYAAMQKSLFPEVTSSVVPRSIIKQDDLNLPQYEAVTCGEGPILVIAGAGSGKTRTLVYRVAHLLEQGVPPENILLLTFTRKAAQEMLDRASLLLDDSCHRVTGGTFHAVANLILRRYGKYLNYASNFTILDRSDSEGIVNLLKSSLNMSGAGKRFPTKKVVVDIFSKAVNKSIPIDELMDEHYSHLHDFFDDIVLIRDHYQRFKLDHGLMDYDDLLVNWKRLLVEFPEVRDEVAKRFSHILVDEYQDTNPIQAEIVRNLAKFHNNVMVVGDDSQSIYSFRGADFRNIMDFPKEFPGCRIIRLEENYRSTQAILTVTNAIIEKAAEKYSKTLFSSIEGGGKPIIYAARNESDQARYILGKIEERHRDGVPFNEMAVLFRSGFHSYKLELELANHHIDFEKRGGLRLTESAHIKDVLAYLRVVCNYYDHLSWNRILLQLEKVGPKTAQTILNGIKSTEDPLLFLQQYPVGNSWKKGFEQLIAMLRALFQPALPPVQMFDLVMGYYQEVFERLYYDDYPKRSRDLEQLKVILGGYDSLQSFIDDTALDPPNTNSDLDSNSSTSDDRLILSTIHSSKGLEWDTVFVMNLVDGKFPSSQAVYPEEQEEERRLLYVAATRAKNKLYFTYPRETIGPDRFTITGMISPFLADIPPGLVDGGSPSIHASLSVPKADGYPKKSGISMSSFKEGVMVKHPFFGKGKIVSLKGGRTVDVFFERYGQKTLHLDYAKLEIVD
jgi:DNA helicase-2/ATP-dependent DNA helicase PcrA